uniref:Uncharacterized protein n=1 Tax=Parascaris equorum TaxID=6256 RepID=A0A914RFC2_PAREQ
MKQSNFKLISRIICYSRLKLENTDREKIIPQLREESRKQYLAKRKVDKLAELEKMVQDDQEYFAEEELTAREKADMKYRKEVLEYARQHDQATKSIPTDYVEEDAQEAAKGDGRRWEDDRLMAAIATYGAKDADKVKHLQFTAVLCVPCQRPWWVAERWSRPTGKHKPHPCSRTTDSCSSSWFSIQVAFRAV